MNDSDPVSDKVLEDSSPLSSNPSNETTSQSGEIGLFTRVVQFFGESLQQFFHRPHDEDDKWAMARSLGKGFSFDEVSQDFMSEGASDQASDEAFNGLTQVMETFEDIKYQAHHQANPESAAS
jgi:hypothetical protein